MTALDSQIIALARAGKPPRLIRSELNVDSDHIYAVLRRARQSGVRIPKFPTIGASRSNLARTVLFPLKTLDRLIPFAARRNIAVNDLVRLIVTTALDDGLIDALLDDAP